MPGILVVVLLVALLLWLLTPWRQLGAETEDAVEPVDLGELEAAEREVRDLGVAQRPEDGFEGDDWGPGAGKPRGGRD